LVWGAFLAAWSAALLTPDPNRLVRGLVPEEGSFLLAKGLHVTAYALLAALSGWLRPPPRLRLPLALALSAHAFATEFLQHFVPKRTPSLRDVALDHLGLLLGGALTYRWWTAPAAPAAAGGEGRACAATGTPGE
jgi:VanZ family protein